MQRYIEQLIEDLHKATWNMKPPHELWEESEADPDDELELEDMSYVEKYIYGEEVPISAITGIEQEQLPPAGKLSQEQQALLAVELENLLKFFHFYLDFPVGFPAHLRYAFIRKFWEEKHVALSFGENHIEFCNYDDTNCPFPGYCNICKEGTEQIKFDEEHAGKSDFDLNTDNLLPDLEWLEKYRDNLDKLNPDDIDDSSEEGKPF